MICVYTQIHTHTEECYSAIKESNSDTCYHMDKLWKHYNELNELAIK